MMSSALPFDRYQQVQWDPDWLTAQLTLRRNLPGLTAARCRQLF